MLTVDYEQMLEKFYVGLLRCGDHAIDVGAHVGRHTLPMAHAVAPAGKVYAYEPAPSTFKQLQQAVKSSEVATVVDASCCALSDTTGPSNFIFVREAPGYSGLRKRHYDSVVTTETISVQTKRIDELFPVGSHAVRYIKIDCEGGELKVLRGASALVMRDHPFISFECGDNSLECYDYSAGDVYDFFERHGYSIRSITDEHLERQHFIAANTNQSYWDYIADPGH